MPKVIAYIRVSTSKQDVDNQRFAISQYAYRARLHVDQFVGETISGYKTELVERRFTDVLDELERGDTLIVSEVSRISRRLLDILNTIESLIKRGIHVVAVKEGIEFKDDINSKVLAFAFGLAAEIERSLISARTREALAKRKADGIRLGRPPGSTSTEALKLYGKDEEIIAMRMNRVSRAAVARTFDVHVSTLRRYMERRQIEKEVLWRLYNKTTDLEKSTESSAQRSERSNLH